MKESVKKEVTLCCYLLTVGINAAQLTTLHTSSGVHAAILGVSAMLTGIVNRAAVTPNVKIGA